MIGTRSSRRHPC